MTATKGSKREVEIMHERPRETMDLPTSGGRVEPDGTVLEPPTLPPEVSDA